MKQAAAHTTTRLDVRNDFASQAARFLSEKPEAGGGVAVATSMSGEGFAAKNRQPGAGGVPNIQSVTPRENAAAFTVGSVALTFLDTTWRMATPIVLFTILGIAADRHFATKPWLTLLCLVMGFWLAILLVKRQLEKVQKTEGNK
jgi:Putative F0F1-ATPase subunit Ca2+/Mg2+ transporter